MKGQILGVDGKKMKDVDLPIVFETPLREDIILKVFNTIKDFQAYGAYILAGKDVSASGKQRHTRHKWKTLYGYGISRVPRKSLGRRGDRFSWIAAFIPGARKGRQAHPPKPTKNKGIINKKEQRIALNSAIASTASPKVILEKYSLKLESLPIIFVSEILSKKPKEFENVLKTLLNFDELSTRKVRAGRGKLRNRKYKISKKILLVVSTDEMKQALKLKNTGVDISNTQQLSVLNLATGGKPGRIAVYTEKAIQELAKRK